MPSGIVVAVGKSRTGKPTVTIDNQIYSASKVDLSGLNIGDKIEFDSASSVYNGVTVWFLNGYKVLVAASSMGPGPVVGPDRKISYSPPVVPQGSGQIAAPTSTSAALTEGERLTVSNWVAAAIQSGAIKDRADLGIWAKAACEAIRFAGKPVDPNEIP
jgi:hypothetical protein